jgi:Cu+-exporting ATPase
MEVSEDVEFKTEYQGTTYYFCAHHCLEEFKKDPSKYV